MIELILGIVGLVLFVAALMASAKLFWTIVDFFTENSWSDMALILLTPVLFIAAVVWEIAKSLTGRAAK